MGERETTLGRRLRAMADRERERSEGDTAEARSYYNGVADGLVMAAEAVEALGEPISSVAGRSS